MEARPGEATGDNDAMKLLSGGAPAQVENQNMILSRDLQQVFNPGRDMFPNKPYFEDGNPEWYTFENMQRRKELKTNPQVIEAIRQFQQQFFNMNAHK